MRAGAKDPEHEVPEASFIQDLVRVLGVALEGASLDEAGRGRRKEGRDAREEEELNRQCQGGDCDAGGRGSVCLRVQGAIDNDWMRDVDFDVDWRVKGDDSDHDGCLGQAEGQDRAARDLEHAHLSLEVEWVLV